LTDTVDPGNALYSDIDGVLCNKAGTEIVIFPDGKTGSYRIPDSVIRIADGAFEQSQITSITIPSNVERIGNYVFSGSSNLSSVTVENTIPPTAGWNMFKWTDTNLSITVPTASVSDYQSASGWSDYSSLITGY